MKPGIITIWPASISKIPPGWLLCDGNNGTPDLRDRFVIGAGDTHNPNDSGGNVTHQHTAGIYPHFHDLVAGDSFLGGSDLADETTSNDDGILSDPAGERPPFTSWAYIMRDDDGLQEFDAPKKIIVAWSGAIVNIPAFWKLCDGTGNTPDFTDRFILGAGGAFAPSAMGGAVNHQHDFETDGHAHSLAAGVGVDTAVVIGDFSEDSLATKVTGTSDLGGILSPYYALAYIQKF